MDIKTRYKEIFVEQGVEPELAERIAEKCYAESIWRPYGGAKSFSELDSIKAAQEYSYKVDDTSYQMRSIVGNIIDDDDMDSKQKVSAISNAASEFGDRIEGLSITSGKSFWDKVKEFVTHKEEPVVEAIELPTVGGFKVFKDSKGNNRWLSLSSNAFEDREKELFTTAALEEAIAYADKTKERGPLLVWHVPSAEIGQCDFQAMSGRFLVESGTFNDTPLGQKALEYYQNVKEEQGVSIGYTYFDGDELDGQYDWLRFTERSVLPGIRAANAWTSFKTIGDDPVNAEKALELKGIFGEEMAAKVITEAETKTKELEQKVRYKELDNPGELSIDELRELNEAVKSMPEGAREKWAARLVALNGGKELEEPAPAVVETPAEPAPNNETMEKLATFMAGVSESLEGLKGIKETVDKLASDVKELQDGEVQRPRLSVVHANRPTESNGNVITDPSTLDSLNSNQKDYDASPAAPYLQDLINGRVVR